MYLLAYMLCICIGFDFVNFSLADSVCDTGVLAYWLIMLDLPGVVFVNVGLSCTAHCRVACLCFRNRRMI